MCKRQNWYTQYQYKSFQSFINPKILEYSQETSLKWEGCISNDEEFCLVRRPEQVKVSFQDLQGKEYDLICKGLVARIFQHEMDHLAG